MTNEQLLQLLGEIDEKHLCGANRDIERWLEEQNGVEFKVERPRKKSPWKIIAAVSCSAAAVLGAVFLMSNVLNNGFTYVPGDPSSSVQVGESEFAVNSEVMWAIGKTVGELTERYGEVTGGGGNAYQFKNGYGIYRFNEGSCVSLEVNASDLLTGDLSTVNLDNIASKYGFDVNQLEPENNEPGMDKVYSIANFSHPSYKNITFLMFHKRSGFDEDAKFVVSYDENSGEISSVESEYNTPITDDYIKTLNSVIDTSMDVVALNDSIKGTDVDDRVQKVQVFENPDAFEQNVAYSAGELKDGAIVLVDFNDGTHYITSRGERTTEPIPMPMMFSHIIRRAGSVEQLKEEIDGYNRGLGDRALIKITLYQNGEDAENGNDNGVTILENGKIVASDEDFKIGAVVRAEYDGGKSWVCFT